MKATQALHTILIIFALAACSKGSLPLHSNAKQARIDDEKKPAVLQPKDKEDDFSDFNSEDATIIPPSNISGSYLFCQKYEESAGNKEIACALRDDKSHNKINLEAISKSQRWTFYLPESLMGLVAVNIRELPKNPDWHTIYTLSSDSQLHISQAMQTITLAIEIENLENQVQAEMSKVQEENLRWIRLNGEIIPENAIVAGSEQMGLVQLYLCRSYYKGGIFPGKMNRHYFNPSKSICYTTYGDEGVGSQTEDATTVLHETDVLVSLVDPDEILAWVPMTSADVIPANAMVTGITENGELIYSCRNFEAGLPRDPNDIPNDPLGEPTPGMLVENSNTCVHEFYGVQRSEKFEILVRK